MKVLKKSLALIAAAFMTLSLLASCSAKAEKPEKKIYAGSYEEKINAFYEDHKDTTAGAMVGVFDKDGVVFKGYYGYSDIANGIKVDENTVIDWGSTTKTMVWVSVMQLWEQGNKHCWHKKLRPAEPFSRAFFSANMQAYSLEEALKLDQPPQVFEPDTLTAYSNWGVALAGYIVERVSGESFVDYVHHHIFEPLDMKDSALAPDLMDNPGVRQRRDKLMCYSGTTPVGNAFYLISLYPAGTCVSTLDDYIKYASCFVKDEFPLFEKQETYDEMMSATSYYTDFNVVKNAHGFWALPYGNNTYGHGGNTQACSSYITFDPEKQIGCVVMTNQAGEEYYNGELFDSIYGRSAWLSYVAPDYAKGRGPL